MHTVEAGKRIAIENVFFAADFSSCSNTALPFAISVARRYGSKLYTAHGLLTKAEMVLMSPDRWPAAVLPGAENRPQSSMEFLEKQLGGVRMMYSRPVKTPQMYSCASRKSAGST